MIWLTWRQFRAQAITAAAALAVFAIVLAATGPHLSGMYDSSGLTTCHGGACAGLASTFLNDLPSGGGFAGVPGSADMILYLLERRGHPHRARDHRHLLGRPADRPRAGGRDLPADLEPEHHPDPVAGGQARADRGWPPWP